MFEHGDFAHGEFVRYFLQSRGESVHHSELANEVEDPHLFGCQIHFVDSSFGFHAILKASLRRGDRHRQLVGEQCDLGPFESGPSVSGSFETSHLESSRAPLLVLLKLVLLKLVLLKLVLSNLNEQTILVFSLCHSLEVATLAQCDQPIGQQFQRVFRANQLVARRIAKSVLVRRPNFGIQKSFLPFHQQLFE
jgi:hypothetical protein